MAVRLIPNSMNKFCMILLCYGPVVFLTIKAKNVPVKIVEEPAVYKGVNSYYQQHQSVHSQALEPRVEPIPFSGPPHLSVLNGQCFSLIENSYKYELCPYHNITQREQTVRWNAFSGILGVFQGWVIVNNTFDSMLMDEGDICPGSSPRQTKVFLKCGNEHSLLSVKEPSTCHYEMDFQTPLACPQDALLVYPVLSSEGQATWESIEEGLWREELTLQGYNKRRKKLFISQGFVAPDDKSQAGSLWEKGQKKKTRNMQKGEAVEGKRTFLSLEVCSNAYDELYAEVERLRKLVIPFSKGESTPRMEKKVKERNNNISIDTITSTTSRTNTTRDNGQVKGVENRTVNIKEELNESPSTRLKNIDKL